MEMIKMLKTVFVLGSLTLVFALSAFGWTSRGQAGVNGPRSVVIEPVKDLGTVAKGETLNWTFTIKNTGNADLQIISAKPGCGCTVADFDKLIKPGGTGKVTLHVDTTAFSGPIAKSVTIETNDPIAPSSQVTVNAVVKAYVDASPAGFVRFNMLQGDVQTQSVVLYSFDDEPFQITKIEAPAGWVRASFLRIEKQEELIKNAGRAGQNQFRIDITVGGPEARVGPLADKVHIVTNSKHQPEYFVSISGVIRPPFRIEPISINFGEVTPTDTAATRVVLLRSNDLKAPERFVVTTAESSSQLVSASVRPSVNKGEYEVTLRITRDAKPGHIEGQIRIFTTDKVNPVVTVPFKGAIK
jgi:hypothetical protein